MKEIRILGILVPDRMKYSVTLQHILTKYGCSIKTRLGLNHASNVNNSRYGLILLELIGDKAEWDKLESELTKLEGIITKEISFQL